MAASNAKVSSASRRGVRPWLIVWALVALQSLQSYGQDFSGYHSGDYDSHVYEGSAVEDLNGEPSGYPHPDEYPVEPTPGYEEHTASGYPYPQTTPLVTMITEEEYPYATTTESYVAAKEVTTMTTSVPYRFPTTTPEPYDDYFPAPEVYDDEGTDVLAEMRVPSAVGVNIVPGTQQDISAYRLGPKVQVRRETRLVQPHGFPQEFSMVSTFRMLEDTPKEVWNLVDVKDQQGGDQFHLRLYGEIDAVDVFNAAAAGEEKVTTFENVGRLFDGEWHKLSLSAQKSQLTLYVDCQQVGSAPFSQHGSIRTDGLTSLATRSRDAATLPVDVQQLQIYSNPNKAGDEPCCDIPGTKDERPNRM
ncbi:collagen alpha-1(IX) chain-like [Acipenser ruthenus]|uniref:collagen alpha-1(IX) chain-like n=1 Tax=Acipenser ruthenus TaxID=7906 RepID=UPI002740869D|nr:collagen alpha-1(IX) chain-like [Acipenser ruthenus]